MLLLQLFNQRSAVQTKQACSTIAIPTGALKSMKDKNVLKLVNNRIEIQPFQRKRQSIWRNTLPQIGIYAVQNLKTPDSNANDWELGLKASWVLFEGFKTKAELHSNAAGQSLADHQLQNFLTTRDEQLKNLHQQKEHLQVKRASVEETLQLAERALSQQRRDFRLGLVTSLEVEQTLQSLLNLKLEQLDLYEESLELELREFLGGDPTI